MSIRRTLTADPRHFQIAALARPARLRHRLARLRRPPGPGGPHPRTGARDPMGVRRARRPAAFDPRSALISGLSLCLLLRTDSDLVAA